MGSGFTVQDLFIALMYYLPKGTSIRKDTRELHHFFYRQKESEYQDLISRMQFDVVDDHFVCDSIDDAMARLVGSGYLHMILESEKSSYRIHADILDYHFDRITKRLFSQEDLDKIKSLSREFYQCFKI